VKLLATPRFIKSVPSTRRQDVLSAMQAAGTAYGHPHLHAGIGLRRIEPFMECRCGLNLRLVFQREKDALVFHLCGTHGEVQEFIATGNRGIHLLSTGMAKTVPAAWWGNMLKNRSASEASFKSR